MGSLLLAVADETAVPAGGALAVDRDAFAAAVTRRIEEHPRIRLIREEVTEIPSTPTIVASGPLTSSALSGSIASWADADHLFFYDAISPIVSLDSIDFSLAFRGSGAGAHRSGHGSAAGRRTPRLSRAKPHASPGR